MTDEEIKQWIDSREAVTRGELYEFVYKKKRERGNFSKQMERMWEYVLQTKNWAKLKQRQEKRGGSHEEKFALFVKAVTTDKRLINAGWRVRKRILQEVYGMSLSSSTLSKYKNILCSQKKD